MTQAATGPSSTLSVVIGCQNARASIVQCLRSISAQTAGEDVEVIVVDNSTDGTREIIAKEFPGVRVITAAPSAFIPQLWEEGIRRSRGDLVALLSAHCVPAADWLREIRAAHRESYPGIGGAIENNPDGSLVDWAVYFLRYAPFMPPFSAGPVRDIPADNASYKRWALEACEPMRRHGFWEPAIHAEIRRLGHQVAVEPKIVACHHRSFGLGGFIHNRFWHGREFGGTRARSVTMSKRFLLVLASPLIPLVYLVRISRQLWRKRRNIGRFFLCLPVLILFVMVWTAGELSGYLRPANHDSAAG